MYGELLISVRDHQFATHRLAPIAAVKFLEASRLLAGNDHLGMAIAQFDLSNRPEGMG